MENRQCERGGGLLFRDKGTYLECTAQPSEPVNNNFHFLGEQKAAVRL